MRVLMLGWEFPPYISGGLGTACHGLISALSRFPVTVLFVLPKADGDNVALRPGRPRRRPPSSPWRPAEPRTETRGRVALAPIRSDLRNPYRVTEPVGAPPTRSDGGSEDSLPAEPPPPRVRVVGAGAEGGYDGDLLCKVRDYAARCVELSSDEPFDVIHAHDWITFPAAIAIARRTGIPLIVHVHATEFDRSGEFVHQPVFDIERQGMHAATRVIAVSERTRRICIERYGVPAEKIQVVYNGIEFGGPAGPAPEPRGRERTVLFLGRITMQKGPEFFVRAAARVAEQFGDVRFVIAGTGDLLPRMVGLVEELGLGDRVEFAGFLRGRAVERAYRSADVFVMPSVSEPFGLTALEAVKFGVPTVISRSSGVAEVLQRGALSVEFWDVNLMARMIVAILRSPALAARIRKSGFAEIGKLTWDAAARRCMDLYRETVVPTATGHSAVWS